MNNPYRPGSNLFGQQQGQQPPATSPQGNIFGQSNANVPFGQQQNTSSIFGQSSQTALPFGSSQSPVPFGQNQNTPGIFGQQSSSSFGQTSPGVSSFGQPAATSFGQPAASSFGQPAASSFGQPAATSFGQPAATSFGQTSPGVSSFGQPAASSFGQPAASSFGQTSSGAPSFGQQFNNSSSLFGQSAGTTGSGTPFNTVSGITNTNKPIGTFGAQSSTFSGSSGTASSSNTPSGQPFGLSTSSTPAFSSVAPSSSGMFGSNTFGQTSQPFSNISQATPLGQQPSFPGSSNTVPLGEQPTPAPSFGIQSANTSTSPALNIFTPQTQATPVTSAFGSTIPAPQNTVQPASQQASVPLQTPAAAFSLGQTTTPSFLTQPAAPTPAPVGSTNNTVGVSAAPAPLTFQPQPVTAKPEDTLPKENEEAPLDQSCLMSSIKDHSVNLYNLKLKEIIDMQVEVLDKNIKEFRKDVCDVFERDMQLIKAKNAYVEQQKNIERERAMMDELSGILDHIEGELDKIPAGSETAMGRSVAEFENVCDKFYKVVENLQDEQGEVLEILNENYELISVIDKKLDALESYSSV
ncbi:hypothetical protein PAEPH01_0170 [Pancytospora epiphaga]|nr:hypothetical protein PAEPH01_0170 [Pancytospora epiphaga]